jgi:hypothetical protein
LLRGAWNKVSKFEDGRIRKYDYVKPMDLINYGKTRTRWNEVFHLEVYTKKEKEKKFKYYEKRWRERGNGLLNSVFGSARVLMCQIAWGPQVPDPRKHLASRVQCTNSLQALF